MKNSISLVAAHFKKGQISSEVFTTLALRNALEGCENVLDVGCGIATTIRDLGVGQSTGLDAYAPTIEKARVLKTHDELVLGDVRHLLASFKAKSFDACVALDVIEHLPKADGFNLITEMEQIARKKVIFLTPTGFLPQGNTDEGDYQRHFSGWEPSEMKSRGYRVFGLLGPKAWRGEYHRLKYKPHAFWGLAALAAHVLYTGRRPEKSAAMLCVKTM